MTVKSVDGGILDLFTNYPVTNRTLNIPVGASFYTMTPGATVDAYDDGYWQETTGFSYADTFIRFGNQPGSIIEHCWLRFKGLIIPPGSTIDSARLYLYPNASDTGTCKVKIYVNDTVTPTNPGNNAQAKALALSSLYVDWTVENWAVDGFYESPDISSLIQYIIDKAGWQIEYNLMVIIKDDGSSASCHRTFRSNADTNKFFPTLKMTVRYPSGWYAKPSLVSGDDGYWTSVGTFDSAGNEVYAGYDSASPVSSMHSFFRIPNVEVSQGSIIPYAYLLPLTLAEGDTTVPGFNAKLSLNNVVNPSAPNDAATADALDLIEVCLLPYSNSWEAPIQTLQSYNIGAILTSFINESSWITKSAILLVLKDLSSTSFLSFYSLNYGQYYPYLLYNVSGVTDCTKGYVWGGYIATGNVKCVDSITYATEVQTYLGLILPAAMAVYCSTKSYTDGFILAATAYAMQFVTETTRTCRGAMSSSQGGATAGLNNRYKGYSLGGNAYYSWKGIQSYGFSSESAAVLSAVLTYFREYFGSYTSETVGYVYGGTTWSEPCQDSIDKFTYSTETIALHGELLPIHVADSAGGNSSTAGYLFAGDSPGSGTLHDDIIKFVFSSEAISTLTETLDKTNKLHAVADSSLKSYICGGNESGTTYSTKIQAFEHSSEVLTVLAETLDVGRFRFSGMQNGGVL